MAQDTPLQHGHLYDIAQLAQEQAVQARRRRLKRRERSRRARRADDRPADEALHPHVDGSPSQKRGMRGEEKAAQYLQQQGLRILARNIHCRTGEIDLVATDSHTLIFVEVRLRSSGDYGGAAASVSPAKQHRLMRTARFFLPAISARHFGGTTPPCRFDVVSISGGRLNWIRHAFDTT